MREIPTNLFFFPDAANGRKWCFLPRSIIDSGVLRMVDEHRETITGSEFVSIVPSSVGPPSLSSIEESFSETSGDSTVCSLVFMVIDSGVLRMIDEPLDTIT